MNGDSPMHRFGELQLFTPGPVTVPPRVLAAGARPMLHHRTPEFSAILADLTARAQRLFGTVQDVLPVHTTGRGAMEGSITNLCSPGDEILAVCNGKFGEMYAAIAERHGLRVRRICTDWLKPLDLDEVQAALECAPGVKAVTVSYCETTTAVVNDVAAVAALARDRGALTLVDAVSAAGCLPIEFDAWGLDCLVTASQKGLMSPTGMSLVALGERAWEATRTARLVDYYVRFAEIRKSLHGPRAETPGSTPVSLVCSVAEALRMIEEEGAAEVYARHAKVAAAVRAGLSAMGLALFPAEHPRRSPALTAFSVPEGLQGSELRGLLKREFGLVAAAGLGEAYKERVVRIGHMGYIFPKDALLVVGALEACLFRLGRLAEPGRGVAACIRALE
jgi:aspartate aminotransferase-like enzyme